MVVGGGCEDDGCMFARECDVSHQHATHVDADTNIIMHPVGGAQFNLIYYAGLDPLLPFVRIRKCERSLTRRRRIKYEKIVIMTQKHIYCDSTAWYMGLKNTFNSDVQAGFSQARTGRGNDDKQYNNEHIMHFVCFEYTRNISMSYLNTIAC